MKKYIITISREFGCGAREIARGLASKLGAKLYDKELVDLTASEAGLQIEFVQGMDEIVNKKTSRLITEFSYGSSTAFYSERSITAQFKVVRDIANKRENCILFGRCADYILREHRNVLNFFLYAPMEYRIKHISSEYDLDYCTAERMVKRVDRERHNYYKYVTGYNRGDRNGKHIMIDVERFGVEKTVNLMYEAIMISFQE